MDRDDESLDYISSAPLLSTPPQTKVEDELDLPTLKAIQRKLEAQIASYSTIDRLTVSEKDFTVKQQLAVSKAIQAHLMEIKVMVDTTIANIKEKYE